MRLGNLKDLQSALGGKVGITYCSALKKAAGVGSVRKFDVDMVVRWKGKNPQFKISDAYPPLPKRTRPNRRAATAGKSCERS